MHENLQTLTEALFLVRYYRAVENFDHFWPLLVRQALEILYF